jgi:hypothetical protein
LAARTFWKSSSFIFMKLVMRSWATAPLAAMIRPLTVPSTVVKATAEITAKRNSLSCAPAAGRTCSSR